MPEDFIEDGLDEIEHSYRQSHPEVDWATHAVHFKLTWIDGPHGPRRYEAVGHGPVADLEIPASPGQWDQFNRQVIKISDGR